MGPERREPVSSSGKTLLRNVIRHTDTHNRLLEEAEMWNIHAKMKEGRSNERDSDDRTEQRGRRDKDDGRRDKASDVTKSFLYDDRESVPAFSRNGKRRPMRTAHMDDASGDNRRDEVNDDKSSTFWLRKLYKAEEGDDERWGHTGYKELYPRDFESDRSDKGSEFEDSRSSSSLDSGSSSSSSTSPVRKKKRKKSASRESHRKKKKRKEKVKKRKRLKERNVSGSESEEYEWTEKKIRTKSKDRSEGKKKRKKSVTDQDKPPKKKKRKK